MMLNLVNALYTCCMMRDADEPWKRRSTTTVFEHDRFKIHSDAVRLPDDSDGMYAWVEAADQVRVAAFVDGALLLIEQHHYRVGRGLQLPGGTVDKPLGHREAGQVELRQETGYVGGSWSSLGFVNPFPSLMPSVKVHFWVARDLVAGPWEREPGEADLEVVELPLDDAYKAAMTGEVTCASSVALILRCLAPTEFESSHR